MKSRIIGVIVGAIALIFCSTTQAQNGIEPRYERYNADRKSIEVDGDLSDWAGVAFIEPRFEASDGRETGKGNSTIGDVTYSTFAEFAGGTWSGPEDHTTLTAVAWDQNGLYLGIVVKDDEHEHAANNAWNGDGVQMGLTDADRSAVTHLYNYCIKDGYESGKVYKNGDVGIIADKEKGPGNYSVAMVRDDAKKTTTYEALFTPDSFGFAQFEVGQQFGFGVCVNDGDKDTPGQKGWSGWGPHMIVFGKTAPDAALVTLTAAEVLASFETDFSDGEIPETAELFGVAEIGPDDLDESDEPNEFLHVTDALNGQNGSMKIQDITGGRTFKEFEVGFRLYISDSTCCGSEDDTSPAHRPADGWSLSIGNELPDTIGLPEEGTGDGIRICFDTWDSGGGEAPAIDVWNGVEGEVGDGDQDAWSGGLFVRQKFDGVTAAEDDEKFKDPETGEFVFMWTHGEWVDFSLKVFGGRIIINYKGYEMINEELPTGWPALTAPQWLFAGRTGGANAAHWVDDFYVKVFKPSGPIISSFKGAANGFSVSLVDAEGNGLDLDSAEAKFDGSDVAVNKSKSDGETTIAYSTDAPLASGSDHAIELTYTDEKGTVHVKTLSFSVPNYIILNADSIVSDSVKGESGFIANITQISIEQTGKDSLHNNSVANAEKQLNGEFIDPDIEEPWLNEADLDAEEGWSYYPVWVEWVNQNQDAPAPVGNFSTNNGYEDESIPGIPGWYDSTDGIAGEYIALLQLDEGAYTLGVNSDDGFRATIGVNYNDILSQELGVFDGGRGASDSVFDILVTKAGLYPFRVLWFEGGGGANIEIFSLVDGEKVLINDPDVEGAIKAFIPKGATVDEQITERDASTGRAAVVSIMPASSEKRVDPASSIEVVIENGSATSVDQSSVKMSVNGKDVAVDVSKSGDFVTIAHTPDGNLEGEVNTAIVSFKESNGTERSAEWSFEVKVTTPAPTLASFLIDFGGTAANSAGASPDPWISLDNLVMDEAADLGGGVTITALDDGFNPNNPAQPGEDADHDGVVVPQEARNDYFFKITDTAGTTARMRIDGLPAGVYNVTVFEGRTTDGNQVAKIWTGEEPEEENTGNFAQGSATVEVNVIAGESLWYMHLEDNTGGVSGMIIRKTSEPGITWDFNDGLPEGSEVAGNTEHSEDEGVDDSGALVITRALNSQLGGWLSPEIGTVSSFIIDFDILMDGGTDTQADGISMAISDDLEPFEAFSEAGRGLGLNVNFDNWDNGDGAPSIEIEFGGTQIATVPMGTQADSTLDTDGWWPVHIELTTAGDLTLFYNDELIHDAVNIEDFEPIENARIAFGGRTGGANANQFIDNFRIVLDAGDGGGDGGGDGDGDAPAPAELLWSVGLDDDGWPTGDGGGANTTFVQEGGVNELPGDPVSNEVNRGADDDYYFAGDYSTVIDGNGDYEPVGLVEVNEEAAERALADIDNDLRYHFNLPDTLKSTDQLFISYDALSLHNQGSADDPNRSDPRYGVEVYFNNVLVQPEVVIRSNQLYQKYNTNPFTLEDVNAEVGSGYDNIITLKGVNYNAEGGGNWMGVDYVNLSTAPAAAYPLTESRWVVTQGATEWREVYDFGDLSGDASYEFFFNAIKGGASTAIAGNDAFAFKLDQWNEQGVFGTTVFGVADNVFTAVEGKSVASVFDRDVHVVLVNDTAAGETRLYVNGDHVGVLDGNFELAGEAKVMAARIEANTDPMADGSVMHKWAVYNSALSGAEIAGLAAAVGVGGGDAPALSVVSNGDGTVTITFEGTLQTAPTVNGPWENFDGASPLTIPADQAQQYGRAVTE